MADIRNERDGTTFPCETGDTILRAALRAGIGMPYSCNTGSCGNCRFELVEGEVRHLRADPPAWSEKDRAKNRWLGCQASPGGNCLVKFRAFDEYVPPVRPATRSARLASVRKITPDISEFAFEVEGSLDFRPGQYALFHVPGVDGPRAYSMSNLASDGHWRFMVKKVSGGAATGWLFDAEPGAELKLDGPFGTGYLREHSDREIVLLAGGSGLSPMVSIARGAAAAGLGPVHLFYGCRTEADMVDASIVPEAAETTSFLAALSEPGSDWSGPTGFLHEVVEARMSDRLKDCEVYFAGPAVMSAAVQKMTHGLGVPQSQLHFDEFY
jgi:toluene monooxygenase electron transfer component